jgi:hypothetical protein
MKISEEVNDGDMKENAKVNFGMANASLKWNSHVTGLLAQIEGQEQAEDLLDAEDDERVEEALPEEEDEGK